MISCRGVDDFSQPAILPSIVVVAASGDAMEVPATFGFGQGTAAAVDEQQRAAARVAQARRSRLVDGDRGPSTKENSIAPVRSAHGGVRRVHERGLGDEGWCCCSTSIGPSSSRTRCSAATMFSPGSRTWAA